MPEQITAPTTEVEVVSLAITMCGKQQTVNTIDGGGALATDGLKLFQVLVSAELASNRWRFAQDFQQSAILTTLTPAFGGWTLFLSATSRVHYGASCIPKTSSSRGIR